MMKKRVFALFVVCALCLGLLAACADGKTDTQAKSGVYSVGYGCVDVTPSKSVPLAGYNGSNAAEFRWSTSTDWPFQVVCVAFTDPEDNTVMLISLDLINATMADGMRDAISNSLGIPKQNIMFHCTHNHSGPSLGTDAPEISEYITQLTNGP